MSSNICKHCGCNEIDEDPSRGDRVCTNCGTVLEEQLIVSDVQFQENAAGGSSVIGQFVSMDGLGKSYTLGGAFTPGGMGRDSRQMTLQNAKRNIERIGSQMHIAKAHVDAAFNYFKMALDYNLTRGRKSDHVLAACLYLVCRSVPTSHMLLDFSDCIGANVHSLGKTYVLLAKELYQDKDKLKPVDPCLYMDRFAAGLEFGTKTKDVTTTALRIVQRMKRDWMHQGRRPSGLCGAALLVAARMHDFNRTVKQIIKVVKVCESTVRKRLMEFEDTPSSQLTVEQFHNIDLSEEQDPPCFSEGKKKSKLSQLEEQDLALLDKYLPEVETLQKKIDKSLEETVKKPLGIWAQYCKATEEDFTSNDDISAAADFLEQETLKEVLQDGGGEGLCVSSSSATDEGSATMPGDAREVAGVMESEITLSVGLRPTAASLGIKDVVADCITVSERPKGEAEEEGQLDLNGIDDEELDVFLLSEDEVKLKTEIWMKENADYLEAQRIKEEERLKQEQEQGPKSEKKRRRTRRREKTSTGEAASATEALAMVLQEKKLSNKINYKVLDDLKAMQTFGLSSVGLGQSTPSILKTESNAERFKRPTPLVDSKVETQAKKRKVQIQEPKVLETRSLVEKLGQVPEVVVETGPVEYREPEAEEDEDEDEEEHISAQQLFGREVEDEELEYDMYDTHD